ncbi:hypothetical protein FHU37_003845 [Allostreptomyces psammosilenae]|uniref:DUF7848 domain-containing protein n=1 Tax=Allostreptomyces psammosilenae TaxID=1892865 RepID=A0A853A902_9ACTN|nr:hypothetical protein [Allostreptomyces psammosilenae]NYI06902.1 hypothetical protein [Allostreptomyces psammosilenae]
MSTDEHDPRLAAGWAYRHADEYPTHLRYTGVVAAPYLLGKATNE